MDVAADVDHWMWGFLCVQNFVPLCLPWVADQPVSASSFSRGTLFVTVLAFVDREEFGNYGSEIFEVDIVRLFAVEHFISALLVLIG